MACSGIHPQPPNEFDIPLLARALADPGGGAAAAASERVGSCLEHGAVVPLSAWHAGSRAGCWLHEEQETSQRPAETSRDQARARVGGHPAAATRLSLSPVPSSAAAPSLASRAAATRVSFPLRRFPLLSLVRDPPEGVATGEIRLYSASADRLAHRATLRPTNTSSARPQGGRPELAHSAHTYRIAPTLVAPARPAFCPSSSPLTPPFNKIPPTTRVPHRHPHRRPSRLRPPCHCTAPHRTPSAPTWARHASPPQLPSHVVYETSYNHGALTTRLLELRAPAPHLHRPCHRLRVAVCRHASRSSALRRRPGRHPLRPPECQDRLLHRRRPLALLRPARPARCPGLALVVLAAGADHRSW